MRKKILTLAVALISVVSGAKAQYVNGHEYVDLGLPSGTVWATMNVGASDEKSAGTSTEFSKASDLMTWGEQWVIPTEAQWTELLDNCDVTSDISVENKTITYYKFTSKINDNYIIFPAFYNGGNYNEYLVKFFWLTSEKVAHYDCVYSGYNLNKTVKGTISLPSACLRLVASVDRYSISDIPDGWAVKTAGSVKEVTVTNGVANNIPVESSVVFTPANIPMGKKVKSIKVVPVE